MTVRPYTADVLVTPDSVHANWRRKEGHSLSPEDLEDALSPEIEVVIIGCGAYGVLKVPQETRLYLTQKGMELLALPTPDAITRYNEISGSGKVIAALHLTC